MVMPNIGALIAFGFLAAMIMGPLAGFCIKKFDQLMDGHMPVGFERRISIPPLQVRRASRESGLRMSALHADQQLFSRYHRNVAGNPGVCGCRSGDEWHSDCSGSWCQYSGKPQPASAGYNLY